MRNNDRNSERKLIITAKNKFEEFYGDLKNSFVFITPASIIFLGDHTHYNDGILLSTAIDKHSVIIARKRSDNIIKLADIEKDKLLTFAITDLLHQDDYHFRYQLCLLKLLHNDGLLPSGFESVFSSEIPECLGLGALASQEVGFSNAVKKILNLTIENDVLLEYVRKCGLKNIGKISNIAHHYTVKFASENKFFSIDLRNRDYKLIPNKIENVNLIIANTKEKIPFVADICNERISECEIGVKGLRLYIWGIRNLRDVEQNFLLRHYHMLPKKIFSRILYNVNERLRSEEALKHLKNNMLDEFGQCITQSHWSIANDYELSCEKCDYLVEKASGLSGVVGSKMISCSPWRTTFHIVTKEKSKSFVKQITRLYSDKFGEEPEFFTFTIAGGLKEIPIKKLELQAAN
jgi:galactokinase